MCRLFACITDIYLISFSSIAFIQAESDTHYVTINSIACPPGYVLNDKCECNTNDESIIDCFDNFTAIVLHVS